MGSEGSGPDCFVGSLNIVYLGYITFIKMYFTFFNNKLTLAFLLHKLYLKVFVITLSLRHKHIAQPYIVFLRIFIYKIFPINFFLLL
jgi:hypothetical protein